MRAARTDKNQAGIVLELRTAGYAVYDYHHVGNGIPDIVLCRDTNCEWVEIKSSRRGTLTPAEGRFAEHCPGGAPIVAWSAQMAMDEFEERRRRQ